MPIGSSRAPCQRMAPGPQRRAAETGSARRCRVRCAGPSALMPQRCALASLASRNTSLRVCRSKMPRRFTQGPRLVETVTSGLVVMMCSASSFKLALPAADLGQDVAEARLRGHPPPGQPAAPAATAGTGTGSARSESRPAGRQLLGERAGRRGSACSSLPAASRPSKRSHSWPGRMRIAARNISICSLRHQAGVVVLVAGERQAHALDGVGDEAGRLVARGGGGAEVSRSAFRCRGRRDWSSAPPARRRTADR